MDNDVKSILVTGASGFIGSFICSEGLERGMEVWAGMRRTSSSQYLKDERLKGVYGPRERDYYIMAKSIKQHVDFAVGYKPQDITFVYVSDVVQAVYKAMKAEAAVGHAYFLSDGQVYNSRAFSDLLQKELGNPWVLHIKAPLWFLRLVCAISGTVNGWLGKLTTLNLDKYHILSQRNWQCDIEPARRDLGYEPQVLLDEGVRRSVQWYKQEGWL